MRKDVQTVLVVDDDPDWLEFLSRALGSEYPVLSAANGDDAVRRARSAGPDVIVMDVMMPGGKDGFAAYAELQRNSRTRDIPVIMLTDINRKTDLDFGSEAMNRYLDKAPAAFLEKPVSAVRLLEAVRGALSHGDSMTGRAHEAQRVRSPRCTLGAVPRYSGACGTAALSYLR
ncbi:MAG: response regulator [Lentisphaerae bacterium]|nr:response regulator [Lentisphaerota bacterium]